MLQDNPHPLGRERPSRTRLERLLRQGRTDDQRLEARVKPEWVQLYPGVDPGQWYEVIQEGEYRDDMEGLWIRVNEWVTYVLARHFDLQARPGLH